MDADADNLIEKLFLSEYNKLLLFAQARIRDPDRAQDIVQDTFHEALNNIGTLRNHPNPQGWLMQTLKYKIMVNERSRDRFIMRFISMETDLIANAPDLSAPPSVPGRQNVNSILHTIEEKLKPDDFYLLKRIVLDGASHLQVAQELGISVWASQKRLERIRKELDKVFPDRYDP